MEARHRDANAPRSLEENRRKKTAWVPKGLHVLVLFLSPVAALNFIKISVPFPITLFFLLVILSWVSTLANMSPN